MVDGAPWGNSTTVTPWWLGWLLAHFPPSPWVGWPEWGNTEAAGTGITAKVEIRQLRHPQAEWLCLGKRGQKTPIGSMENWWRSLSPLWPACVNPIRQGSEVWLKASTLTWSEWQETVTILSFPLPTQSVTRIAIGMISLLLTFLPEWVVKLTPASPHTLGVTSLVKSPSDTTLKWRALKQGNSSMDVYSSSGNVETKLGYARSSS